MMGIQIILAIIIFIIIMLTLIDAGSGEPYIFIYAFKNIFKNIIVKPVKTIVNYMKLER